MTGRERTEGAVFTRHSVMRFRQRVKLPKRALSRLSRRAWLEGLPLERMPVRMQLSIRSQEQRINKAITKMLGDHVFVFDVNPPHALVTILDIPKQDFLDGVHPHPRKDTKGRRREWLRQLEEKRGTNDDE